MGVSGRWAGASGERVILRNHGVDRLAKQSGARERAAVRVRNWLQLLQALHKVAEGPTMLLKEPVAVGFQRRDWFQLRSGPHRGHNSARSWPPRLCKPRQREEPVV